MKYIIMCGGKYDSFSIPKQLLIVRGERIVDRTIRLLHENGIEKVFITSDNPIFDTCDATRIVDKNNSFKHETETTDRKGYWVEAFIQNHEPTCYLFGDVYYSDACIKKIVKSETDDILFFSTAKPFASNYTKDHVEPMAFKVVNTDKFYRAIEICKKAWDEHKIWRHPISFDVWCAIRNFPLTYDYLKKQTADVFGLNFIPIYDYSCDIDDIKDVQILETALSITKSIKIEKDYKIEKTKKINIKQYLDTIDSTNYDSVDDLDHWLK